MPDGYRFARPQSQSLLGALAVAVAAVLGSQASPVLGYLFALLSMVMIIVALLANSIWPTQSRKENSLVFSLFWGCMTGALAPFIVTTFLEGGAAAVFAIFSSPP
jgi:hypothetical protein